MVCHLIQTPEYKDDQPMEYPKVLELMKQRASAVRTVVSEVRSMREVLDYVLDITRKQEGSSVAAPDFCRGSAALAALCEKNGLALLTENLRDHISKISTGLTMARWGIAETATLVVDSTSEDLRIATMLCETHVAVLPKSNIVPDATALQEEMIRMFEAAPRYLAFISGASRTADIERVLTIGVHGPQELHVLVLEADEL